MRWLWGLLLSVCFLNAEIPYHQEGVNRVGVIEIVREQAINQSTYLQVKFALEEYRKAQVAFVLLRLDTPGGEVFAATRIAEELERLDSQDHIPVVAVIDPWALSAGAMLAYSCRYIAVSPQALMGAAEPVTAEGPAPEKINSALRAEMGTLAKSFGRNPIIAEAMVDKDLIVVSRKGEIMKLLSMSDIQKGDEIISSQGKLLTLDADQLLAHQIANFRLPISGNLFEIPPFSKIPQVEQIHYTSWKIGFFSFLTHPLIASLLMMGLVLGFYMEMQHPGMGVPAAVALSCLALILLSHFEVQAIDILELILLGAGIILLACEVFVLPGFGIAGVLGIAFILWGAGALLLPAWGSAPFSWDPQAWSLSAWGFFHQLQWLLGSLILSALFVFVLARIFTPRLLLRSKLVLHETQEGGERATLPPIGSQGEVWAPLRPSGKVLIDSQLYDALSLDGGFIEKGAQVSVSKTQGNVILVSKL